MSHTHEAGLRARYAVREEDFTHADWTVSVLLPRAADELIDEGEYAVDERLPYWADLWPSARALARHLLDGGADAWRGTRVIELGSGVALPSLALLRMGADALATDWYADALAFARTNAWRNGLGELRTDPLDWHHPPPHEQFPRLIAADVLYEKRNADLLMDLLPRILAPGGVALIADPGRVYAGGFLDGMRALGWEVDVADERREPSAAQAESLVRIHRLRAPE
ncbi:class I SAM-dependent methyltransferase [Longimicrobium terrae]|uniref:Putative nicotinamide N-methyase n=1 Tax=Longimicrobium terrae TaxID=1639882 RepID=A0A841GZ54_9BACT|nr:methyltransferase domain-containing protein [Longimicrobium terrae]MBB4636460.1 putative nicotinamide N-methyase [Longimicrobium terrae]MBB6071016.1 putative nicotinamide N-methyase [Longimicrobium terrae]NNC29038.1 methyltransferase type 12 [Longimicrobium terrae]